jgi:hypothetical protein
MKIENYLNLCVFKECRHADIPLLDPFESTVSQNRGKVKLF